jgi:hypothetical protein
LPHADDGFTAGIEIEPDDAVTMPRQDLAEPIDAAADEERGEEIAAAGPLWPSFDRAPYLERTESEGNEHDDE